MILFGKKENNLISPSKITLGEAILEFEVMKYLS